MVVEPLEVVQGLTLALLIAFCGLTWWSCETAWQDGRAWGVHPASRAWVQGQAYLGVGVTLVFVPLMTRTFWGVTLEPMPRALIGLLVMACCVAGKFFTRRGFAIHRDAGYLRRNGPPDGSQGRRYDDSPTD